MAHDFMPDAASVVRWFMTDKDGEEKKEPSHDAADLTALVDGMLSLPDAFGNPDHETTPGEVWNYIHDFSLLHLRGRYGWIDRDGKFWTCGHAAHARLLYWLGKDEGEAEKDGWVRVGLNRYQSAFRMSPKQRRRMKELGVEVDTDKERVLPYWTATAAASDANLASDRDDG